MLNNVVAYKLSSFNSKLSFCIGTSKHDKMKLKQWKDYVQHTDINSLCSQNAIININKKSKTVVKMAVQLPTNQRTEMEFGCHDSMPYTGWRKKTYRTFACVI